MSINDKDITLRPGASNDVWPGSANPTSRNMGGDIKAANFVDDPTSTEVGAGAPTNFQGPRMAKKALNAEAGVVEARPGIIESSNIDPLNENSNKDDGWANAKETWNNPPPSATASAKSAAGSMYENASVMATGAAKAAYGTVVGDTDMAEQGKKAMFGSNR